MQSKDWNRGSVCDHSADGEHGWIVAAASGGGISASSTQSQNFFVISWNPQGGCVRVCACAAFNVFTSCALRLHNHCRHCRTVFFTVFCCDEQKTDSREHRHVSVAVGLSICRWFAYNLDSLSRVRITASHDIEWRLLTKCNFIQMMRIIVSDCCLLLMYVTYHWDPSVGGR